MIAGDGGEDEKLLSQTQQRFSDVMLESRAVQSHRRPHVNHLLAFYIFTVAYN